MKGYPGEATILELGINYLDEACSLSPDAKITLIQAMSTFLSGQTSYEHSKAIFQSIINQSDPLDRLKEIVDIANSPTDEYHLSQEFPLLNQNRHDTSHYSEDDSNPTSDSTYSYNTSDSEFKISRKKTHSWSHQEDTKLLAGIYKYGVDNWTTISLFVGNNRTRAQCSQRWTRGLNPRIKKNLWSYEEDVQLVQLVNTYGDKSWTKIASMMKSRSDVQCRYHYHQIMRDMPPLLKQAMNMPQYASNSNRSLRSISSHVNFSSGQNNLINHDFGQLKMAIEGIPSRYSMPQFGNSVQLSSEPSYVTDDSELPPQAPQPLTAKPIFQSEVSSPSFSFDRMNSLNPTLSLPCMHTNQPNPNYMHEITPFNPVQNNMNLQAKQSLPQFTHTDGKFPPLISSVSFSSFDNSSERTLQPSCDLCLNPSAIPIRPQVQKPPMKLKLPSLSVDAGHSFGTEQLDNFLKDFK